MCPFSRLGVRPTKGPPDICRLFLFLFNKFFFSNSAFDWGCPKEATVEVYLKIVTVHELLQRSTHAKLASASSFPYSFCLLLLWRRVGFWFLLFLLLFSYLRCVVVVVKFVARFCYIKGQFRFSAAALYNWTRRQRNVFEQRRRFPQFFFYTIFYICYFINFVGVFCAAFCVAVF